VSRFTLSPLPARLPSLRPLPQGATVVVVDEACSYPCRRCLRDAEPGEQVVLLSYDPFDDDAATAYRQPGPIFVHEKPCTHEPSDELPDQLTRRLLSVRSFAPDHAMSGGVVIQGVDLRETVERLLADESVAYLHVHNAGPGCFATRIDRAT
jgi:uncharacterized protein DUF1203